jgi:DNA-binding transcriptional regulator YdaS (Cro superfamily)
MKNKRAKGWPPIRRAIDYHGGQVELAKAIGCSQASISYWLNKVRRPSAKNARKIDKSTGGRVTARELLPEIFD